MEPARGDHPVDDNLPEIADEQVHRIEEKEVLSLGAELIHRVEDGGEVHEQHGKHVVEVLGVPEEDKEGGEDHADADVEEDEPGNGVEQAKELPGEGQPVNGHKDEEHDEDKPEVDEGLHIPG